MDEMSDGSGLPPADELMYLDVASLKVMLAEYKGKVMMNRLRRMCAKRREQRTAALSNTATDDSPTVGPETLGEVAPDNNEWNTSPEDSPLADEQPDTPMKERAADTDSVDIMCESDLKANDEALVSTACCAHLDGTPVSDPTTPTLDNAAHTEAMDVLSESDLDSISDNGTPRGWELSKSGQKAINQDAKRDARLHLSGKTRPPVRRFQDQRYIDHPEKQD